MPEYTPEYTPSSATSGRARGRGKSRGGLGKYLRARGRGRGRGRPAEWGQRLVLEDEEEPELEEEEQHELARIFARRELGSNADRYVEPAPELDSGGEEIVEPEVDLSAFLHRQRLSESPGSGPSSVPAPEDDPDVDKSLAHLSAGAQTSSQSKKGKVLQVEWDEELEALSREKAAADATRDLKERFRTQTARQRGRARSRGSVNMGRGRGKGSGYVQAPALPTDLLPPEKPAQKVLEDFLDDLIG